MKSTRREFLQYTGLLTTQFVLTGCGCLTSQKTAQKDKPNVIYIMADDLGYGDLSCYGATQIKTPNIDMLAEQGRRFTNAYAPSATCTPTRYAVMTGQYAWRQPVKKTGILTGDDPLSIEPGSLTLPSILKKAGYSTGLVGKWHLGLGDGTKPIDFNGKIAPGPLEVGFDTAYFIPATIDRVPCVYIKDHYVDKLDPSDPIRVSYDGPIMGVPTGRDHPDRLKVGADNQHADVIINGISRIGYMTGGESARWVDEDITDLLVAKSVKFIEENKNQPFFLYLGVQDPHVPRMPNPRFRGKSGCGIRGDAIVEIDFLVGEVTAALDRLGLDENTLVIFTSDNGPILFDGYFDGALEDQNGHKPAGGLRGWKYLVFEGGMRVPFIARWPKVIKPAVTDKMFCLVDMLATCGSIAGQPIPEGKAIDSLDLSGVLLGTAERTSRDSVIQQGVSNTLAIRKGDWKYIPANATEKPTGIGLGANPKDSRFAESQIMEPLLFNLKKDPAETNNVIGQYPAKAKKMQALMEKIKQHGHR